jgi:hypothetical protein
LDLWLRGTGAGYALGSNYHNYRWYHRAFNWLALRLPANWDLEWIPPDDPTVLELHPPRLEGGRGRWTTVRIGDRISWKNGKMWVTRCEHLRRDAES